MPRTFDRGLSFRSGLAGAGALLLTIGAAAHGQPGPADQSQVEQVVLHPLYEQPYICSEHWVDQLPMLGDALGTDCMVIDAVETGDGGFFMSPYRGDGRDNEDWFGFGARVLAPFDGEVVHLASQPENPTPGVLGRPPASILVFRRDDGLMAIYAHVAAPLLVQRGDRVQAGQAVAHVGNNGYSRAPHIHAGAWRDTQALQIVWDLKAHAEQIGAQTENR